MPATSSPASTSPTTRCCRPGCSPTWTPSSPGSGGPNFPQIPINRPHAPVNDMLRDGFHQDAVHAGVAPYRPNSLDGGCPFLAGEDEGATSRSPCRSPRRQDAQRPGVVRRPLQPGATVLASLTPVEQEHIIQAFTFELGKCYEQAIKERQLRVLANVDPGLCAGVAAGLGPGGSRADRAAGRPARPARHCPRWAVLAGRRPDGRHGRRRPDGTSTASRYGRAILAADMVPLVIGPRGGELPDGIAVQRTFLTGRSVEFDAIMLGARPAPAPDAVPTIDAKGGGADAGDHRPPGRAAAARVRPARQGHGCLGLGVDGLAGAGIGSEAAGIVSASDSADAWKHVHELMTHHRAWDRLSVTAQAKA